MPSYSNGARGLDKEKQMRMQGWKWPGIQSSNATHTRSSTRWPHPYPEKREATHCHPDLFCLCISNTRETTDREEGSELFLWERRGAHVSSRVYVVVGKGGIRGTVWSWYCSSKCCSLGLRWWLKRVCYVKGNTRGVRKGRESRNERDRAREKRVMLKGVNKIILNNLSHKIDFLRVGYTLISTHG